MTAFSAKNRDKIIEELQANYFDILIIGGGITGAGIALDAASRGLKVALVEKQDFAEGTSSRSTKLVHGGLRYLKNAEFSLVREVGKERAVLYQNAPHIVYPKKMFLPIYRSNQYGLILTSLAIWVYDMLAGVSRRQRKKTISKKKVLKQIPTLKHKGLKGAVQYYEYRTNDARLVIENLKKANEYGAISLNYCALESFLYKDNIIEGAIVKDNLNGKEFNIKAKYVVNATGAWVDEIRKIDQAKDSEIILPSKGVHLVVDKKKFPINDAVYFELKDKRMVFVIPTWQKVYIGTTDTVYKESLDKVCTKQEDINYILKALHNFFDVDIQTSDIESTWAGIRPLVNQKSNSLRKVSRKEELFVDTSGLITITGGKLTAYRLMAKQTVDKIFIFLAEKEQKEKVNCFTEKIKLAGSEFDFEIKQHLLTEYVEQLFYQSHQLKANTFLINQLFYTYGRNLELIIEKAYDFYNEFPIEKRYLVWLAAEIWYTTEYEMTVHLSDFLIRRTEKHIFHHKEIQQYLDFIVQEMAKYLDWDKEKQEEEKNIYLQICM